MAVPARTSLINSAEVVIVGAGLAGLACAQRLARAGMDVLIQPAVRMKPLTTFWHTGAEPPTRQRLLHLDADLRGPVVNTAVMTTVAPTYAPAQLATSSADSSG